MNSQKPIDDCPKHCKKQRQLSTAELIYCEVVFCYAYFGLSHAINAALVKIDRVRQNGNLGEALRRSKPNCQQGSNEAKWAYVEYMVRLNNGSPPLHFLAFVHSVEGDRYSAPSIAGHWNRDGCHFYPVLLEVTKQKWAAPVSIAEIDAKIDRCQTGTQKVPKPLPAAGTPHADANNNGCPATWPTIGTPVGSPAYLRYPCDCWATTVRNGINVDPRGGGAGVMDAGPYMYEVQVIHESADSKVVHVHFKTSHPWDYFHVAHSPEYFKSTFPLSVDTFAKALALIQLARDRADELYNAATPSPGGGPHQFSKQSIIPGPGDRLLQAGEHFTQMTGPIQPNQYEVRVRIQWENKPLIIHAYYTEAPHVSPLGGANDPSYYGFGPNANLYPPTDSDVNFPHQYHVDALRDRTRHPQLQARMTNLAVPGANTGLWLADQVRWQY